MNTIIENKESIIKDFFSVFNKENKKLEHEIIFTNPYQHILRLVNSTDKNGKALFKSNRYLEYISQINKDVKERVRLDESYFYNKNIKQLKDNFLRKKEQIIKKTYLRSEIIERKTYIIQLANEEIIFSLQDNKFILLFFVTCFQRKTSNFLIDIKFKTKLNLKPDQNIYESYFNKDNIRRLSVEIELINNNEDINKIREDLNLTLSYLFCKKITDDIILYNSICNESPKIRTISMQISKLKDYVNKNLYYTKKIDGENVFFIIENKIALCFIYGFYHQFSCDVSSKYYIKGYGEYVRHDSGLRELYPFYIIEAMNKNKSIDLSSRLKHFEFIREFSKKNNIKDFTYFSDRKSLNNKERESISIICKNIYGPFNTYEEILYNFAKCYTENSLKITDGLILFLDDLKHDDKKLKLDPTIDILASFDTNMIKKNEIELLLYTSYKNNLKFFKSITNNNLKYDFKTGGFIYDNTYFIPIIFIIEYSILQDKIIKIRLDKLMKYFNNNYKGNQEETINVSKAIVKENITFDYLLTVTEDKIIHFIDKLDYSNNNEKINENINNNESFIDNKDYYLSPLNLHRNWYKDDLENKSRSNFNYLCNLIKTQLIYYASNKMSNPYYQNIRPSLFDLNSGPLTDLNKYVLNYISYVIATDPDKNAIMVGKVKYNNLFYKNNSIFKLLILNKALEEKDYIDYCLNKIIKVNFPKKYNIINIGFNFHFFFFGKGKNIYFNFLKKFTSNNAMILITTNNGDEIDKILATSTELLFNNQTHYIKITKKSNGIINYFNSLSMNESNEEYLIYKRDVIDEHKKNGYVLLFSKSFDYFIKNPEYFMLLSKLNSKKLASKSGEKFLSSLIDISLNNNNVELSKLYRCYIFYKK